jgi:hypothetical protein
MRSFFEGAGAVDVDVDEPDLSFAAAEVSYFLSLAKEALFSLDTSILLSFIFTTTN